MICSHSQRKVLEGKPPHAAKEVCADCGKFLKWLSKFELKVRSLKAKYGFI